jgi:hypothetical protein
MGTSFDQPPSDCIIHLIMAGLQEAATRHKMTLFDVSIAVLMAMDESEREDALERAIAVLGLTPTRSASVQRKGRKSHS